MSETIASDQAARDRISADLDRSLCVEAGAGTGKTTVLVDRVIELLRRGRATIDQLVVVTFTEKAAAELAARVRENLEDAVAKRPASEEAERLRVAVAGIHRARIETIHAFAGSLLRERPVEALLEPGFEVRDGLAAELDFDQAYRDWLARLLEGGYDADIERGLNRSLDLRQLRETAEVLQRHRHLLPLRRWSPPPPDLAGFAARAPEWGGQARAVEPLCGNEADEGWRQIAGIVDFADRVAELADDPEELERLLLFGAPPLKQKGSQTNWQDPNGCRSLKNDVIKPMSEKLNAVCDELRSEALAGVVPHVEGFVTGFADQRRSRGVANYDDLLIWARDLLRDNAEVREWFRDRYRCVLVDEFQDTDPIQVELIAHLCGAVPESGSLVVVGDPKQSIYRFRRADIAIYDAVKREGFGGEVEQLSQNFRSSSGLIGWVNGVFDGLFQPTPGVQPANVRLDAAVPDLPLGRSPVVVLQSREPAANATEARHAEAAMLAGVIARAVRGEEDGWLVRDPVNGEQRAPAFGDFAVLMPTRTEIEIYEDAFQDAGVPYRHEASRAFFTRQEVRELSACLAAIDDPTDELATFAALRSGAFACSDAELFGFYAAGGRFGYPRRLADRHDEVAAALATLDSLRDVRRECSLPELVHRVLERTQLVAKALVLGRDSQPAANLLKVSDQARMFVAAGGGGLRAFARWLAVNGEVRPDEEEATVAEDTDPVVHFMTVHKAKGLEFPIVALANLGTARRGEARAIPSDPGLEFKVGTKPWFRTPGFDAAEDAEKVQMQAEDMRLLYVALTRARDQLIIPFVPRHKPNGLLAPLVPYLPELGASAGGEERGCHVYDTSQLEVPATTGARAGRADAGRVGRALIERGRWLAERDATLARADRGLTITSASSAAAPRWDLESEPAVERPAAAGAARDRAARVGRAVHRIMESVALPDAADLDDLAVALCADAGVADAADEVAGLARACLDSDLLRGALAAKRFWREAPFDVALDDGSLGTGRIDLLFEEESGLVIGDYKTGAAPSRSGEAAPASEHRDQAAVYAFATYRATGIVPDRAVFFFARDGVELTVTVDDALLAEGERLIGEGVALEAA